ncbi:hypothetical protein DSM100688_1203 [Bifidobacterium ramosum]|uniref:Sugar-binding protein n=1 Tax=Bifidobacterium ramosum TaxID=1798158 RepID=A0A6L4X103_9BIFI|nr:FIVAR domain-containing protein [Bifidobacterium ramosum]KAB8288093.1 hypothetical protein DSM100688_1203 [Bifidobacterium ramosum]NEG72687.1 hypothetical protein [Bifidobacterium ramosum]
MTDEHESGTGGNEEDLDLRFPIAPSKQAHDTLHLDNAVINAAAANNTQSAAATDTPHTTVTPSTMNDPSTLVTTSRDIPKPPVQTSTQPTDVPAINAASVTPEEQSGARDIVDTFWDIPPLDFASVSNGNQTAATDGAAATTVFPNAEQAATTNAGPAYEGMPLFPSTPGTHDASATKTLHLEDVGGFAPADDIQEIDDIPVIQPATTDSAESAPKKAHPNKNKGISDTARIIIAVVAVIIVAALVIGGVLIWRNQEDAGNKSSALAACQKAYGSYTDAENALQTAIKNVQSAQKITASQVADKSTVEALKDAITAAKSVDAVQECSSDLSTAVLKSRAKIAATTAETLKASAKTVSDAATAVTDSQAKKIESDKAAAKKQLQSAIDDAQVLLDSSLYNVADDSTRSALQTAIDTATALLKQDDPDTKALQEAMQSLQTASDDVNASVQALADQNAAAQQQQDTTTDTTQQGTTTTPQTNTTTPVAPNNTQNNGNSNTGNQSNNNSSNNGNSNNSSNNTNDNNSNNSNNNSNSNNSGNNNDTGGTTGDDSVAGTTGGSDAETNVQN